MKKLFTIEDFAERAGYDLKNDCFINPDQPTIDMFNALDKYIRTHQRKRDGWLIEKRLENDYSGLEEAYVRGYKQAVIDCKNDILKGFTHSK
jgi:hypothetical protein